ncbi:hypothetical protein [Spirosoma pollinicola]|uniref:Uncharacterized protein n=1 Tax=Spirosoma pollinicola TaxID=2057025 RepID=A0A2K8Z338_9BACT|nr:hypothetical protein [Spirosoma pollinicola]AUD04283.1 hypothetical protein CWM47_22020 [Spirosoma pollinicola]
MNAFFSSYLTLILYAVSNIAAILLLIACYKRPLIARFCFALLFAWASWFNATTALATPWVYTDFADYAVLDVYRWFILGPFGKVATPLILTIAAGQLFISVSMPSTGRLFKMGCVAGILFSIGILPLGIGAAFPAMVFIAMGFYQLWRHPADRQLLKRPVIQSSGRRLQPH